MSPQQEATASVSVVENIHLLLFHNTEMCVDMYNYMGCAVGFLARNLRSWRTEKLAAVDVWSLGKEWGSSPSAQCQDSGEPRGSSWCDLTENPSCSRDAAP